MASTIFSCTPLTFQKNIIHHRSPSRLSFRPNHLQQIYKFRCTGENSTDNTSTNTQDSENNALLKVAWYSSELLGIAASVFRPPSKNIEVPSSGRKLSGSGGTVDRAMVVETIKDDFERSYFVTGSCNCSTLIIVTRLFFSASRVITFSHSKKPFFSYLEKG